jgi:heme exporter protein D
MAALLDMGGYGAYVWPSFAVVLALMAGLALASWRSWRRTRQALDAVQAARRRERP